MLLLELAARWAKNRCRRRVGRRGVEGEFEEEAMCSGQNHAWQQKRHE
jgi:hypothetical protein